MDDLVRWLTSQLDADEETARAAADEYGADWYYDDGFVLARREDDMVATGSQDFLERKQGVFIAAHDPARVLQEIDAKRGIVRAYEAAVAAFSDSGPAMANYDRLTGSVSSLRGSLELLATVYADRPGYQESWRP